MTDSLLISNSNQYAAYTAASKNEKSVSELSKLLRGEKVDSSKSNSEDAGMSMEIGFLKQHIKFAKNTVIEEAMLGLTDEEIHDKWKAEKILFGLGFKEEDMEKSPSSFSGGFQVRLM